MGCINQNSNRNQGSDKIILKIDSKEALVNGETKRAGCTCNYSKRKDTCTCKVYFGKLGRRSFMGMIIQKPS